MKYEIKKEIRKKGRKRKKSGIVKIWKDAAGKKQIAFPSCY